MQKLEHMFVCDITFMIVDVSMIRTLGYFI